MSENKRKTAHLEGERPREPFRSSYFAELCCSENKGGEIIMATKKKATKKKAAKKKCCCK